MLFSFDFMFGKQKQTQTSPSKPPTSVPQAPAPAPKLSLQQLVGELGYSAVLSRRLAQHGIKVRDFAYERTLPPIPSIKRRAAPVTPTTPLKRKLADGRDEMPTPTPSPSPRKRARVVASPNRKLQRMRTEPWIADAHQRQGLRRHDQAVFPPSTLRTPTTSRTPTTPRTRTPAHRHAGSSSVRRSPRLNAPPGSGRASPSPLRKRRSSMNAGVLSRSPSHRRRTLGARRRVS